MTQRKSMILAVATGLFVLAASSAASASFSIAPFTVQVKSKIFTFFYPTYSGYTFLGSKDINISSMRVGREKVRGRALMVLGLDDELDAETLAELARIPNIFNASTARL